MARLQLYPQRTLFWTAVEFGVAVALMLVAVYMMHVSIVSADNRHFVAALAMAIIAVTVGLGATMPWPLWFFVESPKACFALILAESELNQGRQKTFQSPWELLRRRMTEQRKAVAIAEEVLFRRWPDWDGVAAVLQEIDDTSCAIARIKSIVLTQMALEQGVNYIFFYARPRDGSVQHMFQISIGGQAELAVTAAKDADGPFLVDTADKLVLDDAIVADKIRQLESRLSQLREMLKITP